MPTKTLDLAGTWQFMEYPLSARMMADLEEGPWQDTDVPSSIFTSLINAGRIEQGELDANPENFDWVSQKPWIYKKCFDLTHEILNADIVNLVFDGLDTITTIWLNGKLIGKTENMFIGHTFEVKKLLKPEGNALLVKFEPPVEYAENLMLKNKVFTAEQFRTPYRTYIRKAQYQFGWDFCPALPGCGIWQKVSIQAIDINRISDINIRTIECNQSYADVRIDVTLDRPAKTDMQCILNVTCRDQSNEHSLKFNARETFHSTIIHIKQPHLWFPAGYGEQNLYKLNAQLIGNETVVDETEKTFGIRIIKVRQSQEKKNLDFAFEVNDQQIYIKGANFVPLSMSPGSVTRDECENVLKDAKEANINMLRVWAGGYYQNDYFYDICDELGILVWQDFMFACAYYPDKHWFLKKVEAEAETTIKRLRNHPSLAIWCGNNEIDFMHAKAMLGGSRKFHAKNIYHHLLPKLVTELDPTTAYIPTTPLCKNAKFKPDQMLTIHNWQVWSLHKPVSDYISLSKSPPQFVTEFGLQSMPETRTIKTFCPEEKLHIGSHKIEKHNYQLDGNSRLYRYTADIFAPTENIEKFSYLSQLAQARAAKLLVELLRANNSHNNGVLFWQLNDCSPAISWSAIDYFKNPKALYYYAKRFFSDIIITIVPEMKKTNADQPALVISRNVIAINDSAQPLTASINCDLIDLVGNVLDKVVLPVAIAPFSTSTPLKLPKAIALPQDQQNSCLRLSLGNEKETFAKNLLFYLPDKHIPWRKASIQIETSRLDERLWDIELKSDAVVRDVKLCLDIPATLSDNYIDLVPGHTAKVTAKCHQSPNKIENSLSLYQP